MQTHNSLSQQCLSAVSFTGVPSCYTNWINSSYSFPITTIRAVSQSIFFPALRLHSWVQVCAHVPDPFKVKREKNMTDVERRKKQPKTSVCGRDACAKYMVSRFTEQLEQMNHRRIP